MQKLQLKIALLFFLFITNSLLSQWKYPNAQNIKGDVIITYEVTYERELTEAQKKSSSYTNEIVVVFNKDLLIEKVFKNNLNTKYFSLFDYNKEIAYNCRESRNNKNAIKSKFKTGSVAAVLQENKTINILGFPCQAYEVMVKGVSKTVYTTKKIGLKYSKQFNLEGFLLKYDEVSKHLGHYTVTAKKIAYSQMPESFYSLEGFTVRTREQEKQYRAQLKKKHDKKLELIQNKIGTKAPRYSFKTIDGKKYKSKNLLGKVVVLNFWFTSCNPCKKEIPLLNKLKKEFQDKDVEFVAIALDEEYKIASFLRKNPFTYDMVDSGMWLATKFDVSSYPSNIIIDKDGTIQFYKMGYKSDIFESMRYQINKYL